MESLSRGADFPDRDLGTRILGTPVLLWHPDAHVAGTDWRLFDVGGAVGMAGMGLMLGVSVAQHTRALYNAQRLG